MAGKALGQPISFRVDPDLAVDFDRFIDATRGWSKTEVVVTALHHFLASMSDEERIAALMRYRSRTAAPAKGEGPKRSKK